jgi:Asp-tRNA(Asn)/Glu-tRNA(Gln) amidotransferase A subunit family amidase
LITKRRQARNVYSSIILLSPSTETEQCVGSLSALDYKCNAGCYKYVAAPELRTNPAAGDCTLTNDLTVNSAVELVALIRARNVSPIDVMEAHLRRIEQYNPALNAIVTLADNAIDRARAAEQALISGDDVGSLHGLPITVKDAIDTAGLRTTRGSRLYSNHLPDTDATVVARLKAAGAIILGKTNTPEMAIPYESDNPVFGRTNNSYDLNRTAGGSSGGEAAAIASCLSPAGIGSDLSGSIRVPAHFCGISGLKPTTGRVPMDGHLPAPAGPLSLGACLGPMARRVEDLELLFRVIADATQYEISLTNDASGVKESETLQGLHLAWYTDDGVSHADEETTKAIRSAAAALSEAGLQVTEAIPPMVSQGPRLWVELFSRAAAAQIQDLYRGREDEAGPLVTPLIAKATIPEDDFDQKVMYAERLAKAVLERERAREELLRWMKTTPLLLSPVGSTAAFAHGAKRVDVSGESVSVFRAFSYSQTFNVLGFPSVTVRAGTSAQGLPIGVQIVGRPFEERLALSAALVIERALGGWQSPTILQKHANEIEK